MNLKHDEVGRITGTTILALVIVGIVAYLGYGWYMQQKSATGTGITWTAVLENNDQIPINGSTTFYTPTPLSLYADSAHTTKVRGFQAHLSITANTTASGDFVEGSANVSIYILSSNGNIVLKTMENQQYPAFQIPLNTKVALEAPNYPSYTTGINEASFANLSAGTYTIKVIYQINAGVVKDKVNNQGSQIQVVGTATVYWTLDTLTIVPELTWGTYTIV